jgi:hypothetical protein
VHERQTERDPAADVYAHDRGLRHVERAQRTIHVLGLRGDGVVGLQRPVRLAVAEQVDGVRGVALGRQRGGDGAPEKARCAEAMKQNYRLASVAVALDVQRAGAGGDAQEISVDGALRSIG